MVKHTDFNLSVLDVFHEGKNGFTPGTYWFYDKWNCYITADHVIKQQQCFTKNDIRIPNVPKEALIKGMGFIDASIINLKESAIARLPKPRQPKEGETLYVFGSPGGSGVISTRIGSVYLKRNTKPQDYINPTWIGAIAELPSMIPNFNGEVGVMYQPVVVGMSGGCVTDKNGEPLGILVAQGSPTDLDRDGDLDQFFDFVSLFDVWTFLQDDPAIV